MIFYSAIKKNEIFSFESKWMELENLILTEVIQIQKSKDHILFLLYVESKPHKYMQ
jgi:hypothetical protein